jgi:hypothetical protein
MEPLFTRHSMTRRDFKNFQQFYPFYLAEHSNRTCRRLHFVGTTLVVATVVYAAVTQIWGALAASPIIGYGFAWIGHAFFEKNRPASFTFPLYSLMGDWVMFKDMLTGRIKF